MKIMDQFSELKIYPTKNQGTSKVIANGSFVYNNAVRLKFTIVDGSDGKFVSFPSEKGTKPDAAGKFPYFPYIKFVDDEVKNSMQKFVLAGLDNGTTSSSAAREKRPVKKNPLD